jgi:sodium-dependent dicarboxylate transporter 2/3/5
MLLVFMIPSGEPKKEGESVAPRLMDWKTAQTIPWGIVMIIGGGYCIASGFKVTGFTEWVGSQLSFIHSFPVIIIVLLVVLSLSFLTEVNSNTATSNIFVPVLGAMAIAGSLNPLLLMIPGTVACSCAFILPAATGPNSVIFASGRVDVPTMARCGLFLNFIGVAIVTLVMYLIAIPVFGIAMEVPLWAK